MNKVEMSLITPWIAKRITELLSYEDEVVINMVENLLQDVIISFNSLYYSK